MQDLEKAILFFDGECGLCQRSVRLLARIDFKRRLYFAPLQSITAQRFVTAEVRASLNTIVFKPAESRSTHIRSEALIEALKACHGGAAAAAYGLQMIPKRWRDAGYKWIAHKRHALSRQFCPLPPSKFTSRQLP